MALFDIFSRVVNMSLTGCAVIAVVIIARLLLRKGPKVYSYALWAVVLFRLLCPVSLPSPVSVLALVNAPVAQADGVASRVEYIPSEVSYREVITQKQERDLHPESETWEEEPAQGQSRKKLPLAQWVAIIWIAGVGAMGLFGAGTYLRFRKKLVGACRLRSNIYLADHIDTAFVTGLFRPKIYLPSDLPAKQMGYIIAHEKYHIRRLDHGAKFLAFAALCIHWFNPLVWAAFILSGRDMEMSCDEAVIKKLGEGIRADYSASLLTLAMGRRIIAGTPLAFGEGDTKGRVLNMAKWKKPRLWVSIVSCILCLAILAACGANPVRETQTAGPTAESTQPAATETQPETEPVQTVQYSGSFTNDAGDMEYHLNIEETLPDGKFPIIEVEPYYLTEADVQRVARVLFGDAEFYEAEPLLDPVSSKSEIKEALERWNQYASVEALEELSGVPGEDSDNFEFDLSVINKFIDEYTEKYETALEDPHRVCDWTFKPDSVYMVSADKLDQRELENDNSEIAASVTVNGVPYSFSAAIRDREDYKLSSIYAFIQSNDSPLSIDSEIFRARLARTEKPTDGQITAVKEKAELMLEQMELGEWMIDDCCLETTYYGETAEYVIHITAVPVLEGVPILRRTQLNNLKSEEEGASRYYLTDAAFNFSANGDLLYFEMMSPVTVRSVVDAEPQTMTMDELMDTARDYLAGLSDSPFSPRQEIMDRMFRDAGEEVYCRVDVNRMEYGLTRIAVAADCYQYIPTLILKGRLEYCGRDSGEVYLASGEFWLNETANLTALNALDGSVIYNR